jgi:hypothetical protein
MNLLNTLLIGKCSLQDGYLAVLMTATTLRLQLGAPGYGRMDGWTAMDTQDKWQMSKCPPLLGRL